MKLRSPWKRYADAGAAIPEGIIAAVLAAGLAGTWAAPARLRTMGLASLGFALGLTLVGAFVIAIGIGPRTTLDVVVHVLMLALVGTGLWFTARRVTTDG